MEVDGTDDRRLRECNHEECEVSMQLICVISLSQPSGAGDEGQAAGLTTHKQYRCKARLSGIDGHHRNGTVLDRGEQ